jgi:hypothetical protein
LATAGREGGRETSLRVGRVDAMVEFTGGRCVAVLQHRDELRAGLPQSVVDDGVVHSESYQVEQDLILSRLVVEIASNELLGGELVMRGGTCLHKLHLPKPYRYSEDLDYVRRTTSPIGPYLDQLREVAGDVGLSISQVQRTRQMVHMILDTEATDLHGQIRIKVETSIAETTPFKTPITPIAMAAAIDPVTIVPALGTPRGWLR